MQLIIIPHSLWGLRSLRHIKRIFTENWYQLNFNSTTSELLPQAAEFGFWLLD